MLSSPAKAGDPEKKRPLLRRGALRLAVDDGSSVSEAVARARPPVHFRRQAVIETALRNWTSARLERVMAQLSEAVFDTRRQPVLAESIAHRALASIAVNARQKSS